MATKEAKQVGGTMAFASQSPKPAPKAAAPTVVIGSAASTPSSDPDDFSYYGLGGIPAVGASVDPGTTPAPAAPTPAVPSGTAAVEAILNLIGMGNATANDGTPLASWLLNSATASGLDPSTADPTALQGYIDTVLPQQTVYQDRFPGIMQQLAKGENPTTPSDYLSLEDTARGLATQYGVDYGTIFTPSVIANLVVGNVSGSELSTRFNTYVDAYESAPPEVQQAYNAFYGTNGLTAFVATVADPTLTDDQLKQNMEAADIQGAGSMLGMNVGQDRATQLAKMGVSYSGALTTLQSVTKENGLYTPTVGEGESSTGKGATAPVTENNQGVSAAFGLDPNAVTQVNNEKAERANEFNGGGGGAQSSSVGAFGAGAANSE